MAINPRRPGKLQSWASQKRPINFRRFNAHEDNSDILFVLLMAIEMLIDSHLVRRNLNSVLRAIVNGELQVPFFLNKQFHARTRNRGKDVYNQTIGPVHEQGCFGFCVCIDLHNKSSQVKTRFFYFRQHSHIRHCCQQEHQLTFAGSHHGTHR